MMYSPCLPELDTIVFVYLFDVYTLLKTTFILIGVCHCAKLILIEFMSPRLKVDNC